MEFTCGKCGAVVVHKKPTRGRKKCPHCGSHGRRGTPQRDSSSRECASPCASVAQLDAEHLPSVSVVIPTHNGWHHLRRCLPTLYALDYPREKVEIIVVDNASGDDTDKALAKEYPSVRVISQDTNHYARANNLGIVAAGGDYIALLNNDTEVESAWLRELVNVIHPNPTIGAVGSKVLLMSGLIHTTGQYEQPNHHWGDRGFEAEDAGQYEDIEEMPSLCGVAVLYRRACIDDVGLQDERFVAYYEDVDYSLRCRKKGWKLFYVPRSVVHHFYNGTASNLHQGEVPFTRYYTERNRLLLLAKHDPERIPEALATHSHFYVDKDYRILYESMPVVLEALSEGVPLDRLQPLLARLFENLRKIALYEGEGVRAERQMYKHRLRLLEEEWQQNLQKAIAAKEAEWRKETGDQRELWNAELERVRADARQEKETEIAREQRAANERLAERDRELGKQLEQKQREMDRLRDEVGAELAVAREALTSKIADKLKLNMYGTGTKEEMIRNLKAQLSTQERDLKVALQSAERVRSQLLSLREEHEAKVRHFLEAEGRTTEHYAELLELRKRLAENERQVLELLRQMELLQKRHIPSAPPGESWLPMIQGDDAIRPLEYGAKPEDVHWSIINRCFFRCQHCDIWKNKDALELSTGEGKLLLQRLHDWLGPFRLHVAGGEPFMRRDLLDLLHEAIVPGNEVTLTTNGYRIDEKMAGKLAKLGLRAINISVDGFEAEHNRIRGVSDSYHRALTALKLLSASGSETHVIPTTVMTSRNLAELPEMVRWAEDQGFNGITFQALCNEFSSEFTWDWWKRSELWPTDTEQIAAVLDELIRMKLRGAGINNSVAQLQSMKHYFSYPGKYPGMCSVGFRSLHLNEKGDFLLCWNMSPAGNALHDDLPGLWAGAEALRRRHQVKSCARECFVLNCNYG